MSTSFAARVSTSVPGAIAGTDKTARYGTRVAQLLRARWPILCAYLALMAAVEISRALSILPSSLDASYAVSENAWDLIIACGGGALLPVLTDAVGWHGWRRVLAAGLAAMVGVAAGVAALYVLHVLYDEPFHAVRVNAVASNAAFALRALWVYSMAGLGLWIYTALREREAAMTRAVQAAELERAESQHGVMESRLKVMQARVEPELLFGALTEVQRLYERDADAADALLDDLITYLRAALPQMRAGASTLSREAMLAQAFLKIVPAGRQGRLHADVHIPAHLADVAFPPMVLLPLAHAAADAAAAEVVIDAWVDERDIGAAQSILIAVTGPGHPRPAEWSDARLAAVRAILERYSDGAASLSVEHEGDKTRSIVRWPTRSGEPTAASAAFDAA